MHTEEENIELNNQQLEGSFEEEDDSPSFIPLTASIKAEPENENDLFEHFRIKVDAKQSLMRIDKFLMDRLPNSSRNKIQNAIERGLTLVNNQIIKASYKIKPFDEIVISFPYERQAGEILPENIPLDIIYEDDAVLIINKKAGMVVHPAHGNWDGTLVNALVYHFQQLPTHRNGELRPGLVHRIDKDTSGLLVIAKTDSAMTHLANQFFHHTIDRQYLALVWGEPKEAEGTIRTNLTRHPKDRRVVMATLEEEIGKHAITHYKVIEPLRYVSLVQCHLETGRTHQIRAHMRYLGHPLFNDAMYGGDKILKGTTFSKYKQFVENCFKLLPRQALHAQTLGFTHPVTGERMHFEAPLPADISSCIEKWRAYVKVG